MNEAYEDGKHETYMWSLYGPDDTEKPEPTQHQLEKYETFKGLYGAFGRTDISDPPLQTLAPYAASDADVTMKMLDYRYETLEQNVIEKETADSLERQAERLLARAAEVREKYSRFGEDDFPAGAVIIFDKRFNEYGGRPIPWSKPYHYAALKDPNGLWNTTGPRSPKGYSWNELIRWMGEGVEEIYYVAEMTKFVG